MMLNVVKTLSYVNVTLPSDSVVCIYHVLECDSIIILCHEQDYALKVITETNESWAKLVKRSIPAGELSLV